VDKDIRVLLDELEEGIFDSDCTIAEWRLGKAKLMEIRKVLGVKRGFDK
jgi:hypothetical protein